MSQVTSIREQWSEGKTISEIARAVSVDRNTVYKYTQMTDFSKAVALYVPLGCMLDKHAGIQGQVHHSLPSCHKAAGGEGDGADREDSWILQGPGPSHH